MVAVQHAATRRATGHQPSKRPGFIDQTQPGHQPLGGYQMNADELITELATHDLVVDCDAPDAEQPVNVRLSSRAVDEAHEYGMLTITTTDARRLVNQLQRVLNEVAEYRDNAPYIECRNPRCGNEVDDDGDYCAFCVDAGKGTPAWGPIR